MTPITRNRRASSRVELVRAVDLHALYSRFAAHRGMRLEEREPRDSLEGIRAEQDPLVLSGLELFYLLQNLASNPFGSLCRRES